MVKFSTGNRHLDTAASVVLICVFATLSLIIGAEIEAQHTELISRYGRNELERQQEVRAGPMLANSHKTVENFAFNYTVMNTSNESMTRQVSYTNNSSKIMFVHVGKAGGMTLRTATFISCLGASPIRNPMSPEYVEKCLQKFNPDTVLPYRAQYVTHMFGYSTSQIQDAESFLFVLRHPVDRYVSAFYFHHPDNSGVSKRHQRQVNQFYVRCFPTVEDLAQLGLSPGNNMVGLKYDHDLIRQCSPLAIAASQGMTGRSHFRYNYKYYADLTTDRHPQKPVYVVRTENEWNDMVELDQQLGGSGNFTNLGLNHTHGSELYRNQTYISTEGYQKLCCSLANEIEIYESILLRAINLDEKEKQKTIRHVRHKCGIRLPWLHWKSKCLDQIDETREMLDQLAALGPA